MSLALSLAAVPRAGADMIEFGAVGVDGVVVHWIGQESGRATPDSIRAAVTVEPIRPGDGALGMLGVAFADARVLPMEATIGFPVSGGNVELTRFKATLLRAALLQSIPVELLSGYRDLDRGIEWGADLLGFRVPVKITPNGEIVLLPGAEFGIRHYGGNVDATAVHASFVLDARAAVTLIEGWLTAGAIASLRAEAVTQGMSGIRATGMGFLALALDSNNRLYLRLFGGAEYDSNRADLGMPAANVFAGLGIYGNFGGK